MQSKNAHILTNYTTISERAMRQARADQAAEVMRATKLLFAGLRRAKSALFSQRKKSGPVVGGPFV